MDQSEENRRLNSWKQIARYLGRDRRTVMRWEKQAGMPVHRIPGSTRGRSVYAFTRELDAWLEDPDRLGGERGPPGGSGTARLVWPAVAAGLAVGVILLLTAPRPSIQGAVVEVRTAGDLLIARDADGFVLWTHRHPEGYEFRPEGQESRVLDLDGDGKDEVLLGGNATAPMDERFLRGELVSLSAGGEIEWHRTPEDALRFGAESYGAPWVSANMDVLDVDGRARIIWSLHHHTWWPSMVLMSDGRGELTGRFVNSGWILADNSVRGPTGDLVVLGGISNSREGAMLAVLAGDAMWGHSPEEPGSGYECLDCPGQELLRYFVFPPTHVNRGTGLPYNQTVEIRTTQRGIAVVVLEGSPSSGVEWVYDFSPDFELLRITPGDRYWPEHRLLRLEGKIDHTEEACPERVPPPILSWTAEGGWVEVRVEGP